MDKKLSEIKPYPKNAKKHPKKQVQQIADSIKEFGFNQPIVVDKDNVIIVGHGRYEAAQLLGLDDVPVLQVDLSKKQAMSYRLADNKLNESDWDMDLVIEELKELDTELLELTGFDKDLTLGADDFGEGFELPDGDKSPFQQITFTLADEQAEAIKEAVKEIKGSQEYEFMDKGGNENSNGNAISLIVQQWVEQRK